MAEWNKRIWVRKPKLTEYNPKELGFYFFNYYKKYDIEFFAPPYIPENSDETEVKFSVAGNKIPIDKTFPEELDYIINDTNYSDFCVNEISCHEVKNGRAMFVIEINNRKNYIDFFGGMCEAKRGE